MTTAIDAETDLAAVPINLTGLHIDGRSLIADAERNAEILGDHATKSLRVLIIEDDLTIGPLLAETLEQLGHVVCALEVDAAAAITAARRCHPDLMIVDIGLGEASGIAVVEQILKEGFVPHVFVTGDGLRRLSPGSKAILIQKPYKASDLVAAIARAADVKVKRNEPTSA
jgi:two-component system, response regulator PdtaR